MTLMHPSSSGSRFNVSNLVTLRLAEYTALRDEMVKRVVMQHLLSALAVATAGALLAIGIPSGHGTLVLYYPMLAAFLSFAWAASDRRVRQLGAYILGRIEAVVGEDVIGWEHFSRRVDAGRFGGLNLLASRGIFVGTQLLTLIVGASLARFSVAASVTGLVDDARAVFTSRVTPVIHSGLTLLVVLDLASVGVTLHMMRQVRVAVPPAPIPMEYDE